MASGKALEAAKIVCRWKIFFSTEHNQSKLIFFSTEQNQSQLIFFSTEHNQTLLMSRAETALSGDLRQKFALLRDKEGV